MLIDVTSLRTIDDSTSERSSDRSRAFGAAMLLVVTHVREIAIRPFETAPAHVLAAQLLPPTLAVLDEAIAVVDALVDACNFESDACELSFETDDDGPKSGSLQSSFERDIDKAVRTASTAPGASLRAAGDIGFMAVMELRQRRERLRRVATAEDSAAILGECDGTLRRIRKALGAVDAALAACEHRERVLDFTPEVELSLRVRRTYARLRRDFETGSDPSPADLHARLRLLGTRLAILVGKDVYPELRVRDRVQLRSLQERILGWLRAEERDGVEAGLGVWKDAVAFLEMLTLVNRRQELIAHDDEAIRDLRAELARLDASAEVSTRVMTLLASLEGRDADIDALLARRTTLRAGECRRLSCVGRDDMRNGGPCRVEDDAPAG
jgi:hypothetical protein